MGGAKRSRSAVEDEPDTKARRKSSRLHQQHQQISIPTYSVTYKSRNEDMILFFVIPDGKAREDCLRLGEVYRLADSCTMRCQWISEGDCIDHEVKDENIFILEEFSGLAYDKLSDAAKCLVVGPQVLKYILNNHIRQEEVLDLDLRSSSLPFYTLTMKNLVIFIVSEPTHKTELTRKVKQMFGELATTLNEHVTHVVTENVIAEKVLVAYKLKIPVMTTEWIGFLWEKCQTEMFFASDRNDFDNYVCPIFHNLVVCMSQMSKRLKEDIKKDIEENGGIVKDELVKGDTGLLIVSRAEGRKYEHAKKWKIPCVLPEWVEACVANGSCVKWKDYSAK